MQQSQSPARTLLTALEVQGLLHIDRSTVYRMAEDGRLPGIRVGRSWRFPADRIEALATQPSPANQPTTSYQHTTTNQPTPVVALNGTLNAEAARAAVEVASDLLGVMMVVTDMSGRPLTDVANPSGWFRTHAAEPGVLDQCVAEWRDLADHPDLTPEFRTGSLGFQCARAFIRDGSTLVGMVLAGGVSPAIDPATGPDLYHLDDAARQRVLGALPRIAVAISHPSPRPAPASDRITPARTITAPDPAATATPAPDPDPDTGATTKENR